MKKKTALTIAGSDSSGGAGIQADLKTMHGCGVFGMSAITAITAQNTTGVKSIQKVSPEVLGDQLDMVFSDIYPDAVKIGMTFDSDLIEVIADRLLFYKAKRIVLDPVMVATSGAKLLEDEAIDILQKKLMPMADLLTPNIPEAEVLLDGRRIETHEDMEDGAKEISERTF
jgi:hydroxymethylpyrimidine kinase/phosphomethylpyrimidine kinase